MSVSKMPSAMGSAALQYARRGWPVFPCRERPDSYVNRKGDTVQLAPKQPYITGGLKNATCDEARILDWWRQHPDALIGLPTGANGCFVLDFDPRVEEDVDPKTGEVTGRREWSLEQLKAELEAQMGCALPRSVTALTQSGGVHVYFRQPEGDPIRNRGNLPEHVDVRGLGGYVIAPPSAMADHKKYRWLDRGDWRDDAAIAAAPPALVTILRAPKAKPPPANDQAARPALPERPASISRPAVVDIVDAVRRYALAALDGECQAIRRAGSGQRNAQLNTSALKVASLVAAGALDERLARAMVEAAGRDNPGRDDDAQLLATVNSGWTAGLQTPRDLAEVAAAARSRTERSPRSRPAPPPGPEKRSQPFHAGSGSGDPAMPADVQARMKLVARAWLARRCDKVERSKDAITRLAFGVGRRVAAGLLDEAAAKEALWAIYENVADVQHADVDRALGDGANRGFDVAPLLLTERCSGYPLTDFGIGERFRDRFGADFRFTTAKGWLGWDGRRWKVLDQDEKSPPAEVVSAVFGTVRAIQDEARYVGDTGVRWTLASEKEANGRPEELHLEDDNPHGLDRWILKGKVADLRSAAIAKFGRASEVAGKPVSIAALARRWLTVSIEQFDTDPFAITVLNGTLRFRRETAPDGKRAASAELRPHDRADLNTRLAPVDYDRAALCPDYDAFFAWAQPDVAMRRYLHQWGGYSSSGHTGAQILHLWWGGGGNGKSTTIDLWHACLGDYAGTIGIETFLDQGVKKRGDQATPDLARLGGVRMLRASEPGRGAKLDEPLIKSVTGGEPMAVRALHRGFFDLQPLFKLTISFNPRPEIPGTDQGIWRRVRLIPWGSSVAVADQDGALPERLRLERNGVFLRLVDGLLDWMANGFAEPDAVREATAEYREDSDPLGRFLKLCTEPDEKSRVQSSRLYEVFVAWAKAAGASEWKQTGFSNALKAKGLKKKQSDGMWWLGIRLVREAGDFVDGEGRVRVLDASEAADPPPARAPPAPDDDMPL